MRTMRAPAAAALSLILWLGARTGIDRLPALRPAFLLLGTLGCLIPALLHFMRKKKRRRTPLVHPGRPEAAHLYQSVRVGALFVFPALLARDAMAAALRLPTENVTQNDAFLLPALLFSLLSAFSEGLFYRGWLEAALSSRRKAVQILLPAALFALSGASLTRALPRLALGILLSGIARRHRSLASSMAAHAAFLMTLCVLEAAGLGGGRLTPLSAGILLAGCFFFYAALLGCFRLAPAGEDLVLSRPRFTRREGALLALGLCALILAPILLEVL